MVVIPRLLELCYNVPYTDLNYCGYTHIVVLIHFKTHITYNILIFETHNHNQLFMVGINSEIILCISYLHYP